MKNKHLLTHKTEWRTPDDLINFARRCMGSIDLDAASSAAHNQHIRATHYFSLDNDALRQKWFGNTWLNPPYARGIITDFVDKAIEQVEAGNINRLTMLTNSATDTLWTHKLFAAMNAVCFLKGRVSFLDEAGEPVDGNMEGQVLWYYGNNTRKFLVMGELLGKSFML